MTKPKQKLQTLRTQIDALDVKILKLLNQRAKIAERVGALKRTLAMDILDAKREQRILKNVAANNKGPLSNQSVQDIFKTIVTKSRRHISST